jgi:hypothetical protein
MIVCTVHMLAHFNDINWPAPACGESGHWTAHQTWQPGFQEDINIYRGIMLPHHMLRLTPRTAWKANNAVFPQLGKLQYSLAATCFSASDR